MVGRRPYRGTQEPGGVTPHGRADRDPADQDDRDRRGEDGRRGQLTAEGVAALRSIGGQQDLQRTLWLAHALIGIKGAPPGSAVEASGPGNVTASVGRPRPLAFTLETFSLR